MGIDETVYVALLMGNRREFLAIDRWADRRGRGGV